MNYISFLSEIGYYVSLSNCVVFFKKMKIVNNRAYGSENTMNGRRTKNVIAIMYNLTLVREEVFSEIYSDTDDYTDPYDSVVDQYISFYYKLIIIPYMAKINFACIHVDTSRPSIICFIYND